ncbi:MAG: hypothetical protein JEZ07_16660 [Phycisphaerae bacterium]|nr:hypothetical protein [Phycisphaerae bacterium]
MNSKDKYGIPGYFCKTNSYISHMIVGLLFFIGFLIGIIRIICLGNIDTDTAEQTYWVFCSLLSGVLGMCFFSMAILLLCVSRIVHVIDDLIETNALKLSDSKDSEICIKDEI